MDGIDLADLGFWARPLEERAAAFAALRRLDRPPHYAEVEIPEMEAFGFRRGDGQYALVKYADVAEASRRPEVFCSSRGTVAGTLDPPPEFMEYFGSMITMDDPRHARLRRIVSRAFTAGVIARITGAIDAAAVRIIEDFRPKGGGDFVAEVAGRLPLKIICDLMGVPEDKHDRVFELSNLIVGSLDPEYVPDLAEIGPSVIAAGEELRQMVYDLAAERADKPEDDLTSVLMAANVEGESLTGKELGSFFILLIVAGNETTRNATAHGLDLLTRHPEQRALWMSDFERYAPTAVEEIVRYASPVTFMRRTVTRDYELGGHTFKDGDKVLLYYCSANRDETVFTDPDTFDITRDPNPHLGFGAPGPHFCLGAHLARQELTVMFRELFRRLPEIRATAPPERLTSAFINGIKHLECAF